MPLGSQPSKWSIKAISPPPWLSPACRTTYSEGFTPTILANNQSLVGLDQKTLLDPYRETNQLLVSEGINIISNDLIALETSNGMEWFFLKKEGKKPIQASFPISVTDSCTAWLQDHLSKSLLRSKTHCLISESEGAAEAKRQPISHKLSLSSLLLVIRLAVPEINLQLLHTS